MNLYARSEEFISVIKSANPMAIIGVNIESITVRDFSLIQDFYVYPFQKGEIVTASGTVFVYLNVVVNSSYPNSFSTRPVTLTPPVEVKFNLPYIDGNPAAIHFESLSIPFSSGMILPEQVRPELPKLKDISLYQHINLSRFQAVIENQSIYNRVAKVIWDFKEPPLLELDDLKVKWDNFKDLKREISDPASKYIPKKGAPQPFKKGATAKRKKKRK